MTHAIKLSRSLPGALLTGASLLALAACGEANNVVPERGLKVSVAPLNLPGVTDAEFTLAVYNGDNALVWQKSGLTSKAYGNGKGDLTFVGPCDASSNDNRVDLTIVSLSSASGLLAAGTWQNPTASGPLSLEFGCIPNAGVEVVFNVTILRQANQGFFDIAVTFDDIFCSAKLDCVNDEGDDLILLHDPVSGERSTTVVMAFACTAGGDATTWIHLNDVNIACADGASYWFNPSLGPGNIGGREPAFFQAATYRGREDLPGYDKCYWNMALGVREGVEARSCVLSGQGTATENALQDGKTQLNTAWPYVKWAVALTDASGQLVCGAQALNAEGSQVQTDYTPLKGSAFTYSMECATTEIQSPPRQLCGGSITGLDSAVAITSTGGGISVSVGGQRSPRYVLDSGFDVEDCCLNPCCTSDVPTP